MQQSKSMYVLADLDLLGVYVHGDCMWWLYVVVFLCNGLSLICFSHHRSPAGQVEDLQI